MSILAQMGHGPARRVVEGVRRDSLAGLVLSPKHANLARCAEQLHDAPEAPFRLFDPQFHLTHAPDPPSIGCLVGSDAAPSDYAGWFSHGLDRRSISAVPCAERIASCFAAQQGLDLTHWTSPTVLLESFGDAWSQVALDWASASVRDHRARAGAPPLLVSIVASLPALADQEKALDEYLDLLTGFEPKPAGFYIVCAHAEAAPYPPSDLTPSVVSGLLSLVHVLAVLNDSTVVVGYADLISPLLHAAGAAATACGWHNSLRRFCMANHKIRAGGRRPQQRYTSRPALSSLTDDELRAVDPSHRQALRSGSPYDAGHPVLGSGEWTSGVDTLHHWWSLDAANHQLGSGTPSDRIERVQRMVADAVDLRARLDPVGRWGPNYLLGWQQALQDFRANVGV